MNNPVFQVYPDITSLAEGFCEFFNHEIKKITDNGMDVHICLSGGNTPKMIFRLLADKYKDTITWDKTHFYWGDERCVPSESTESNYGEAKRALFDKVPIPSGNIHPIIGENNPDEEIKRYAGELTERLPQANNLPAFDIMVLGMGDDGHTASIFPDNMKLLNLDELCAVAHHPQSGQQRVTLTGNVLNNAAITCFLITGKNKASIFKQIYQQDPGALKYPANHIKPYRENLYYFLDKEAASEM